MSAPYNLIKLVCKCGQKLMGSIGKEEDANYNFTCNKCNTIYKGTLQDYIRSEFPNGFVKCQECGAYYDSVLVYMDSHTAPDYEWRGECGHARLKWKSAPKGTDDGS